MDQETLIVLIVLLGAAWYFTAGPGGHPTVVTGTFAGTPKSTVANGNGSLGAMIGSGACVVGGAVLAGSAGAAAGAALSPLCGAVGAGASRFAGAVGAGVSRGAVAGVRAVAPIAGPIVKPLYAIGKGIVNVGVVQPLKITGKVLGGAEKVASGALGVANKAENAVGSAVSKIFSIF